MAKGHLRRRGINILSAAFYLILVLAALSALAVLHPQTPLPDHWNPARPLDLTAPVTPLTRLKLARSLDGATCLAALETGAVRFEPLVDLEESEQCHIRDRLTLSGVSGMSIAPVETRCATALRLALWAQNGLEPAADKILGSGISRIHHFSSYSCRQIRTEFGSGGRMSTHATADAIDIAGFTLTDGRTILLVDDWGQGDAGAFLRTARDSSCEWFATTLGPDHNTLHADHFHLQSRGWGLCR